MNFPLSVEKIFRFPDFEISWAGMHPTFGEYCFGSDDGRFRMVDKDGHATQAVDVVVNSGEAINGIAFSGDVMAVSTRCDVVIHVSSPDPTKRGVHPFDFGAHGILATSSGGFVAPLGYGGLLRIPRTDTPQFPIFVNRIGNEDVNICKIDLLCGDGKTDVIACAARRDGILSFNLVSDVDNGRPSSSLYFKAPGLDVVDLCSLGSTEWPYGVAALGADGTFHLIRDLIGRQQPTSYFLDGLSGTPYSILQAQGHLFILTSKSFYTIPNIVSQFLGGGVDLRIGQARKLELPAVDAYATRDEILIEMIDGVLALPVGTLVSNIEDEESNPRPYLEPSYSPEPFAEQTLSGGHPPIQITHPTLNTVGGVREVFKTPWTSTPASDWTQTTQAA